jgi:hypothetical protein
MRDSNLSFSKDKNALRRFISSLRAVKDQGLPACTLSERYGVHTKTIAKQLKRHYNITVRGILADKRPDNQLAEELYAARRN